MEENKKEEQDNIETQAKPNEETKTQKKKTNLAKTILVIILVAALLAGIGYFGMLKFEQEKIETTVKTAFEGLKSGDATAKEQYLDYGNVVEEDATEDTTFNTFFSKLDYKIVKSKVNFKTATITVELTNKDIGKVFENYFAKLIQLAFSSAFSSNSDEAKMEEQLNAYLEEQMNSEEIPNVTNNIDITLEKENGEWKITNDQETLLNVVLPGFVEKLQSVQSTLGNLAEE